MPGKPSKEAVLDRLLRAHEAFYDVSKDYEFAGRLFPGYAEFHTHGERFVLSKKAKLWEVDAHEYLFFETCEVLDEGLLKESVDFMIHEAVSKVDPVPNHMTSYLTLVIVAESLEDGVRRVVGRSRFRKNFRFGLRGWADLRLAVLDLERGEVLTNGQGKEIRESLEANLRLAQESWAADNHGERG